MVHQIPWRGDEQVLDIGTGSGITLIGCAQQLNTGRATGIDIWDPHAGGGTPEIFWRNARAEHVADRVDLQNVDARNMPFADGTFDVVVSSFAAHHFGDEAERTQAAREIARVVKPGGQIVICDVEKALPDLELVFQKMKFQDVWRRGRVVQMLTARRAT